MSSHLPDDITHWLLPYCLRLEFNDNMFLQVNNFKVRHYFEASFHKDAVFIVPGISL